MSVELLVLPGDGIGPEIAEATRTVLEAADRRYGLGLAFETAEIGFASLAREGTTLPERVLERARAVDGVVDQPALAGSGAAIESALGRQLAVPAGRTTDLGGALGTAAFAEALATRLESAP